MNTMITDSKYIGHASQGNPVYDSILDGQYFVYDKWNYRGDWAGYQVAVKTNFQYCVSIGLPYTTLQPALSMCDLLTKQQEARQ